MQLHLGEPRQRGSRSSPVLSQPVRLVAVGDDAAPQAVCMGYCVQFLGSCLAGLYIHLFVRNLQLSFMSLGL